ncbi:MAG TPA: NAD(+) synthase [Vicinamibacterales bacterium]|nr:NAD(+) synthase [Vicinamibacterales bacterium]
MRVALAQINPFSGDLRRNASAIIDRIAAAAAERAEVVVTPELALPGYCIGDLVEDAAFLAANENALQRVAEAARGITAIVGFIDHDPTAVNDHGTVKKYNAAAVVRDGRVIQRARKSLLPSYRYFDDKRFFSPGERRDAVDAGTGGPLARIGVSICEDLWDDYYDVKPVPELVAKGAAVVFNLNASPFYPGKREIRHRLIKAHVDRLHRPIVYVNTVGAADNGKNIIPFDGESLVYDGTGRLVAMGRQFEEDLIVVDLESNSADALDVPPAEPDREMYAALMMALRDYMRKVGFAQAVVAVSGGIDSALALAIAVDALGADRVSAFNLPSRYNTEATQSIARRLASAFGVRYTVIPIQKIDDEIRADFERHAHPIAQNLTRENLHARIRGVLMMAESNDSGALLISCGNETEIALGYATLYGDMCGGISLIGDLSKIDVYNLARYVNRKYGREMIPDETFTITPSAELAEGQCDPFDYAIVAPIVGEFIERRTSPEQLAQMFDRRALDPARFKPDDRGRTPYDKHTPESFRAVVFDAYRRMRRSVYKRLQGPPIVVVSERAFGFDLRETIINGWEG